MSEYNNQPYFNFVKCLEEKRKDVDWEHRWELQLADRSLSTGRYKGLALVCTMEEQCLNTTINHILIS